MSNPTVTTSDSEALAALAEKLNLSTDELKGVLDAVKAISPEIGGLAESSLAGPVGIAAFVYEWVRDSTKDELAKQDKVFDEFAKDLAQSLGADAADYNKHVHDAKQAVADLQTALAQAGTDTDPIGAKFKLIKTFADVFIEGVTNEVAAQGRLTEATLVSQNATPRQIIAARQRTSAILKSLDQSKNFFDGSGLLMLEQTARQQAQAALKAASQTAVLAQQQAAAKNEDRQKEIQQLKNETGQGELHENDPAYLVDQKQIANAEAALETAVETVNYRLFLGKDAGVIISPELAKSIRDHDPNVIKAKQELQRVLRNVQGKQERLIYLQGQEDDSNQNEADATVIAQQRSEQATQNQHGIDQLPGEIAEAQSKEWMQQVFDTQVGEMDAQTDKILETLPAVNTDQGGLSFTPDINPGGRNIPLNFPGGAGAAGGRRLDPERLNEILAGLVQGQDVLKKSLAEAQAKQAQMETEIESVQQTNGMLSRQIKELQRTGGK